MNRSSWWFNHTHGGTTHHWVRDGAPHAGRAVRRPPRLPPRAALRRRPRRRRTAPHGVRGGGTLRWPAGAAPPRRAHVVVPLPEGDAGARGGRSARGDAGPG